VCAAECWGKVKRKVCRKTSVKDVEKGDDIINSRESAKIYSNKKAVESALNKMAFVDDKHIENFETLAKRAKSLEFKLEDRTRELADLILNNDTSNFPEDKVNNFGFRVEDRTRTLEDKLDLVLNKNIQAENRTKTLEDKLEDRTKKLEDKLDLILNNSVQTENRINLELRQDDRTKSLEEKLDLIVNNNMRTENRMYLELRLEQRNLEDKFNTILEHLTLNK